LNEKTVADMAASFQAAAVDVLAGRSQKAMRAMRERGSGIRYLVVAGGVAANEALSGSLCTAAAVEGFEVLVPPARLCTDNGAMVAWAGLERMELGLTDSLAAAARARWPLDRRSDGVAGAKA
jgi:N6-L-threonylcarbamoyladenine synthase